MAAPAMETPVSHRLCVPRDADQLVGALDGLTVGAAESCVDEVDGQEGDVDTAPLTTEALGS